MKTSIKKDRPQKPLNLSVLKYRHRKMYSGGDVSQELNWSKACLPGFLSSASVLRDEDASFFLVYRGYHSGSNSGESQKTSRNVCVLVDQLGLLVGWISGPRKRLKSKLSAIILPFTDWQDRQYRNGCRICKFIETCKSELFKSVP